MINDLQTSHATEQDLQPGFLIRRLHQIHLALFAEECAAFNITPVQYNILAVVARQPGLDQSHIGEEVGVDRATIANVVARLEAAKLLKRNVGRTDRRQKLLSITARGRALLSKLDEPVTHAHERTVAGLAPKQRDQFIRLLADLVDAGNDFGRAKLRLK
ncbi:MAG: MarR family transcriptional regulator [Acidocella sp.]|nr:MarR family transcriptional regulator [Acidocella sp.]